MRGKWRKRWLTLFAATFAGLLMCHGMPQLASDLSDVLTVHADGENVVTFTSSKVEANDAGLIYVDLYAEGVAGQTVTATYRTSSATAIETVDYVGVSNTISLKLEATGIADTGTAKYTIAIKCLNDSNTRETLRVYDSQNTYGRYFTLSLTAATNATLGSTKSCQCYLPYDYKVSATTGITDSILAREVAYLDDYKNMLSKYHSGDNDISGKEHWRTWKEGARFECDDNVRGEKMRDVTRRWVNTYINRGFANAYGSYVIKNIDDDKIHSSSNIYMLSGNREFMDKYEKSSDCPGLSLYYEIEPCTSGGYRIDGKAMYYISKDINPYKQKSELVDLEELHVVKNPKQIYWIQEKDAWYSSKNSIYDSVFYKTPPYNGILDYGLSIFNNNKSWDREVHDIWLFLALVDEKAPSIIGQYSEYNPDSSTIRVYLRFDEPVYASKKKDLVVKINGKQTSYYANYVMGNYTDTLVYEIPSDKTPTTKITQLTYQLPNEDIGDMAYSLDRYKVVSNNLLNKSSTEDFLTVIRDGSIDLAKPSLSVDRASSIKPQNVYDIMISAAGESGSFDTGTVYYTFDKNEYINDPTNPASYASAHVLTSEERGSFGVTLMKNEAQGFDSGDYYLHALAVSRYDFKSNNTFGPYRLDGDTPEVDFPFPTGTDNELKKKIYNVEVKDKSLGTSVDKITMLVQCTDVNGVEQVAKQAIIADGVVPTSLNQIVGKTPGEGKTIFQYRSNIDEGDASIPQDSFILNLMGERPQMVADVSFEVVDEAGNKSSTPSFHTTYDKRALFENNITIPGTYQEDTSITLPAKVYDIHSATEGQGIRFEIADPSFKSLIDGGATYGVIINGGEEYTGDAYSVTLKDFKPGYYEAMGHISGESGGTSVDLVSKSFAFYLTDGMDDPTINKTNAQGNLVLTNRVFQLEDAAFYYYNSASSTVATHLYGAVKNEATSKYEGGSSTPTFSSIIEAKKYVKFMEYKDLELISISSSIASLLNGGSGSTVYVKAPKETKNAQEGQLWVRYKKSSWTPSSGPSGWAFYYYGEGRLSDGININGLSENLRASMDAVTTRLTASGIDRNLVGEDYTNRITGAPYLADSQMHVSSETYSQTMSGNLFVSDPLYRGDEALFNNDVTVDDVDYPLATNLALEIGASTSLYYKYVGGAQWNKLDAKDGTLLKDALGATATGLYTLREYGEGGVSEFTVYVDRSTPVLNVTINQDVAGETPTDLALDGNVTAITCKNLVLRNLVGEADNEAFVAVYSYPNRALQTVLYGADIAGYALSGGNYYLLVGDRSGNVVSYVVRAADSKIDATAVENESKTGIVVRVNNREASEIYSYEVYLNEVLIDNEYDATKFYRGSGAYRIEITDIYGESETLTCTHEAPSPDLTWYYLNDNGGYSVYDPSRPVRMILEDDPNSSRVTNVYASTMVRVLINGADTEDVEFELLDIEPNEYSFNASTGLLTINSLVGWRLRVWYKNAPENDRTYIFHVDTAAPEVAASFMGTAFTPTVVLDDAGEVESTASFDHLSSGKYQEGDLATLDTLAYSKDGQMSLTFDSGAVISGDRIVLAISDPSGLRSVAVTRNGQPLEMQLNADNELIITSYGTYVVTMTDNLGNVTVFTFTNVEGDIAQATLDGDPLGQDTLAYGHDALEATAFHDGTATVLVTVGGESFTYEFRYESGRLTYGQYYVRTEDRLDENDNPYVYAYGEYIEKPGFSLSVDSELTKRNVYYLVVEDVERGYAIYAMIGEDGLVRYKVTTLGPEIQVELSVSAGTVHVPNRYLATLSKAAPTLRLLTGGEEVERVASLDYIYITNDLTIDETAIDPAIVSISYAYSATTPEEGALVHLYENGEWKEHLNGTEFGYYRIVVTNKYNNITVYLIDKIESFASVVNLHYLDGTAVTLHGNEGTICSNYSIELLVFSTEVHFEVNDEITSGYVDAGVTSLTLTRDGTYHVRIVGANGIFETFDFVIHSDQEFLFQETWIIGYNEEALLRDQGYTNLLGSIVLDEEEVTFVDLTVDDDRYFVLYDVISDEKKTDLNTLKEAIGRYGIGKYTIGFRNKYGDLVSKTIHYNNIPSIILTRTIVSDPTTYQTYDLGLALEKGFYSNNVLRFGTTSSTYVFTVDGVEYRLDEPKVIEFSNISGKGSFSYRVTYRDEYGNYVEFDAILNRVDVDFDSSTMETIAVGSTLYTKGDVCITFAEGLKATLSIDGGEAKDYFSGQMHYADGEYRFVVRDIAGNIATYVIVHKSVNHYTLTHSVTGEDVVDGGVINNASVVFASTDGSHIRHVVRNGEVVEDYNSNTFANTGHYEIIIEDAIGNQSYEEFTILNNSLATFDYDAPFEYEVTEVWRVSDDGTRELLNTRGPKIHLDQNGDYVVVVTSTKTASSFNFSVTINNAPPTATLVGAVDGGVTAHDVSLSGLKVGDVVKIYKDGELVSTTTITLSTDVPTINSGGRYRIVITNVQGVTIEYAFTRKAVANVAGSIFFIVSSALIVVGLGIGLIYHTKLKTDD